MSPTTRHLGRIIASFLFTLVLAAPGSVARATEKGELNRRLLEAVRNNDPSVVAGLLNHGANPNLHLDFSWVPELSVVHYSVPKGRKRFTYYACSILHWAAAGLPGRNKYFDKLDELHDNTAIVGLLLKHGARVNSRDRLDRTPLMLAAWGLRKGNVLLLLNHNADARLKDNAGDTARSKLWVAGWEMPNLELSGRSEMRTILDAAMESQLARQISELQICLGSFASVDGSGMPMVIRQTE